MCLTTNIHRHQHFAQPSVQPLGATSRLALPDTAAHYRPLAPLPGSHWDTEVLLHDPMLIYTYIQRNIVRNK